MYKNFTYYEILADGRIWSKVKKKFLKPQTVRGGYQQVGLYDNNGKRHFEKVHKVVFFAVNNLWEYPEGYEINHLNEDKTMNAIWNLSLTSRSENINYGTRTERQAKAMTNHPKMSKRVAAYNSEGELMMMFDSAKEAQRNGYNQSAVSRCCNGKLPHYKGFVWKFLD